MSNLLRSDDGFCGGAFGRRHRNFVHDWSAHRGSGLQSRGYGDCIQEAFTRGREAHHRVSRSVLPHRIILLSFCTRYKIDRSTPVSECQRSVATYYRCVGRVPPQHRPVESTTSRLLCTSHRSRQRGLPLHNRERSRVRQSGGNIQRLSSEQLFHLRSTLQLQNVAKYSTLVPHES